MDTYVTFYCPCNVYPLIEAHNSSFKYDMISICETGLNDFEPHKNPSCIDLVITNQRNLIPDCGIRSSLVHSVTTK